MTRQHPYAGKPGYQFWKNMPPEAGALDPVIETTFKVAEADRVVTAGSCFAQHVARHLTASGMCHHVTEAGHPLMPPAFRHSQNYGMFAARYGNIYTARQLHQTLLRAYGQMKPEANCWRNGASIVDPFRPQIQPRGFISEAELERDRAQHFAAIRQAIEEMDVFVFTLGLTEAWLDRRDGAVYPLAPGVAGGEFNPDHHTFHNFSAAEVTADMLSAIAFIRERNASARIVITVSPVPLNATAMDRHVLVSTAYSKAVLRVAAEEVCAAVAMCDYFPSYEIITAPSVRGKYFAEDSRSVLEAGVEHVMSVFFRHYREGTSSAPMPADSEPDQHTREAAAMIEVLCDEEAISA